MFRIPFSTAKSNGSIVKSNRSASRHRPLARKMFLEPLEARTLLSATVYPSGDVPLAIPDQTTILSTLVVPDAITIDDINVTLDIEHTRDQDLDVFLIAPNGARVELMTDVGGGGDNFIGTTFDDEAASSIVDGSAPFVGAYRPEGSLSVLNGLNAAYSEGKWTLEVTDDKRRETGTLNSWSIEITSAQPALPSLSIDDVQLAEGDIGTTAFVFTVTRSGDVSGTSDVDFTTADGTANVGTDYVAAAGTLQFLATETSKNITVQVNGDTAIEPDETFSIALTNPSNATIADGAGQGSILDDDTPTSISIDDVTAAEGDESFKFFDAFVSAGSGGLDESRSLSFGPDGNLYVASGLTDEVLRYDASSGAFIDVFVSAGSGGLGDLWYSMFGPDGHLYVNSRDTDQIMRYDGATGAPLRGPLGAAGTAEFVPAGSGGLDGPPEFDFGPDGNLYVPSGSSTLGTENVLRYDATGQFIDVFIPGERGRGLHFGPDNNIYLSHWGEDRVLRYDGTTGAFMDEFVAPGSGGLVGQRIQVFGPDGNLYVASYESDSVLRYDGSTGAFIDAFVPAGSGGLDGPFGLLFGSDGSLYVSSLHTDEVLRYYPASQATFTVSLSVPSASTITVDFDTSNGTATAASDYVAGTGTLTFAPGVISRTIIVPTMDDGIPEADETFFVNLSNPSTGATIADPQGVATILDSSPRLSIDDVTVIEGDESVKFLDAFVSAGSGGLDNPRSVSFGPDGNLYVGSRLIDEVLRYDGSTGAFIDVFVSLGDGGMFSTFGPDGDFYVSSFNNNHILRYDGTTGDPLPGPWGSPGTAEFVPAGSGGLLGPMEFDFGPDGYLYVSSGPGFSGAGNVLRYDATGQFIDVFVSGIKGRGLQFGPDNNLYVSRVLENQVLRYDGTTGAFIDEFVQAGSGGLYGPRHLLFGPDGNLYVGSFDSDSVLRYDGVTGAFTGAFVQVGSGGLDGPVGMVFDPEGRFYVASHLTDEILRYGPASQAAFTVSRSRSSAETVTVNFTTADGTATAGSDYLAGAGTLTFEPGVTSRTIIVPTSNDPDEEDDETFFVNLSGASPNATIADPQGVGTILDNDAPQQVFQSTDVPKTIADPHPRKGPKPAESQLPISAPGDTAGMFDVDVTIVHASMTDLTVTLRSPGGLEKPLFFDGADWNLVSATDFWTESLHGDWTLTVTDTLRNGAAGTLENWSITVSTLSGDPGVTVTPTSGLSTTEAGGTASFYVVLNSQPSGAVSIHLYPTDTTEARLERANSDDMTLVFDPLNWYEPQEIVVIGVDDDLADGDISYEIIVEPTLWEDPDYEFIDPEYEFIDPEDVLIINYDDMDVPPPQLADFSGADTAASVTLDQVEQITSQALALWSAQLGVPVASDIQVALADLAPGRLGEAYQRTIALDINANGAGWFVDESPWEHSEFGDWNSPASGRVDLLSVVAHEVGHVLGFEHSLEEHDVMAAQLGLGTRRLPGGLQLASPLEPLGFQALDELFAAFGQMEATQQDDEDQAIASIDDDLLDLLAFTPV